MSAVRYDAGTMTIELYGLDEVREQLGAIGNKTPAVAKTAINATARQARKLMIAQAKARYAVNAAGVRQLKKLKQRQKATNGNLSAELFISSFRNDMGYFQTNPNRPYMGHDVVNAPEYFRGKVLRASTMDPLTGTGKLSKGFLVEFKSGHVGMVQRIKGTGKFHYTVRSGAPSMSDKMRTMGSPSGTAMHGKVWFKVEPEIENYLLERLSTQLERELMRASARTRGK